MPAVPNDFQLDVDAISRIPVMGSILEVICKTTGMGFAAVARVTEDRWIACSVRDEIQFGLKPGGELQVETTICHEIRQSGNGVTIDHTSRDEQFKFHPTPKLYGFESYISLPIIRKDGSFFGTLCAIDPAPAKVSTPEIIGMFRLFADLIAFHLSAVEELSYTEALLDQEKKNVRLQLESRDNELIYTRDLSALNKELAITNQEQLQSQLEMAAVNVQLKESEERFRSMAENSGILIAVGDETGNAIYFSKAWVELTGMLMQDMLGFGWANLIHPEDKGPYLKTYMDAFKEQLPFSGGFRILSKEGSYRWLFANGRPRFNPHSSFDGYISSCLDVTEQKQDEQRKNDFIGMVSHELKTPLTSVKAYLQMLQARAGKAEDAFTLNALDKANNQVNKMTNMINGFLNVSRLESGQIHIERQQFDMAALVTEVEEEYIATVTSHQIIFAPVIKTLVIADRDKIGQVINNFLNNAVKYAALKSTIYVSCITIDGTARVSVRDQGPGIMPGDQQKLFDRYYRVQGNQTKTIAGFGIGLYLCAEIIQRHDGRIWVESEVGKGATFYFSLKLA